MHEAAPQGVEHLHRQAFRIGGGLQHDRRHGGDEDRFGDPLRPVAADIARDFPASGGVAHQRGVLEIERLDDGRKIVGIAVHVVSGGGLAGPAMATPVMGNHAEAVLREEKHLAVPRVRAQRPAVRERDDRARAPVLVLDVRTVACRNRWHQMSSFRLVSLQASSFPLFSETCRLLHPRRLVWPIPLTPGGRIATSLTDRAGQAFDVVTTCKGATRLLAGSTRMRASTMRRGVRATSVPRLQRCGLRTQVFGFALASAVIRRRRTLSCGVRSGVFCPTPLMWRTA